MYTATTGTFGIQSFLQCGLITWVVAVMSVGSSDNSKQLFLGQPLQMAGRKVYLRNELLALRDYDVTPARSVRKVIFMHRLWLPGCLRDVHRQNWKFQQRNLVCLHPPHPPPTVQLPAFGPRSAESSISFAFLNVRSLLHKCNDVIDCFRARRVDVFCFAETWHDVDSACIGRFRSAGYHVVDRLRPRVVDDLSVNHGGVAIVASPDVEHSPIEFDQSSTFEIVGVRATVGRFTGIVVAIYRPGSAVVPPLFFEGFTAVLDRIATFHVPVYVASDFNIRLDRPDDSHAVQLRLITDCYGLTLHDTVPSHQLGGTLDAVITRNDVG
jgi:hypothetical protein